MAKKPEKASTAVVDSPSNETVEAAPTEAPEVASPPPTSAPETTALAPAPASAVAVPNDALAQAKALASRLPAKYKAEVLMNPRPSADQLVETVLALPDTDQSKMLEIVKKANPKKQGAHTAKSTFSPTPIILFHGVGKDEMRPKNTIPGHFYTKDAHVLGEKFEGAVLALFEGRIMWPPRQGGGAGGGDANQSKAPLCVSFDQVEGSRYGECKLCPNASKQYNQGGCMEEVTIYLIDRDMSGIYELKFNKSSQGAGKKLVQVIQKSENIWDRWISFESQERTQDDKRWFVIKATPVADTKVPANNSTPKHLHKLFSDLSRVIDHDVYYAGLADTYDRSKTSPDSTANGGQAVEGNTFNPNALLGNAATDNPDYSTDV